MKDISAILTAVAVGLDAIDAATPDAKISLAAKGAATVVRLLASITTDRSPEEVVAILEQILENGAKPISQAELDAQVDAAIAKAT